jgi:hypothetical protein
MKPSKILETEKYQALGQCHSQAVQSGFDTIWRDLDASRTKCPIDYAESAAKYAAEKLVYLKTVAAFEQAKQKNFNECNGNSEGSVNVPAPTFHKQELLIWQ